MYFKYFIEERKRISEEISILKNLKHPNVIHFISAWYNKKKEEVVFITEMITGGSLKKFKKIYEFNFNNIYY